jgi:hypothetical protein
VQRELTSDAISTGDISEPTQIVLHRQDLTERFEDDPEGAIASLHRTVTAGKPDPDALFALSELAFHHAEDTGNHAYYLAAAVYAFTFLFPDDPAQRPNGFDPRFRTASDLYNRSLTSGFASADRSRVLLRSGRYELPFGTIDVTFDPATARWGNLMLVDFTPADELHIKGLQNRYRQRGIGAPLAADIETRKESDEGYSSVAGFFKQYELAVVAADERDVVRVRSNVRGEDVRIYRLRMTPANAQVLLREYVEEANRLARAPRFYNTLTANCTNLVFDMVRVIHPGVPMDVRVLFSGYLPNYA